MFRPLQLADPDQQDLDTRVAALLWEAVPPGVRQILLRQVVVAHVRRVVGEAILELSPRSRLLAILETTPRTRRAGRRRRRRRWLRSYRTGWWWWRRLLAAAAVWEEEEY